jgi:hypothetical protein
MMAIASDLATAAAHRADAEKFLTSKLGFVPAGDPIDWARAHGWKPPSLQTGEAPPSPSSAPPQWSPEMEKQYKEYRRGGAAGPAADRTLWTSEFEARLKKDLGSR